MTTSTVAARGGGRPDRAPDVDRLWAKLSAAVGRGEPGVAAGHADALAAALRKPGARPPARLAQTAARGFSPAGFAAQLDGCGVVLAMLAVTEGD